MKPTLRGRLFGALTAGALLLLGAPPGIAQITGTKHDFKAQTWSGGQICIVCHTPHNALSTLVPLWNHATTATASFTLYASNTLNATPGQPGGVSKACLSCHDGTVALANFGGATGGATFVTGSANLGTDLSNDHPFSFTYDGPLASADGGLVTPAGLSSVVPGIPLYTGKLECASCHNVHSNMNAPFLRASNSGSALCLKCHIK